MFRNSKHYYPSSAYFEARSGHGDRSILLLLKLGLFRLRQPVLV
jgi:hypothetical protein